MQDLWVEVLYSGCRKDRVKGDIRVEVQDLWWRYSGCTEKIELKVI